MNIEDMADLIRASVARGSSTPTLKEPRDVYLREKLSQLLDCLIEPIEARVVAEMFDYGVLEEMKEERIMAVARSKDCWLLYRLDRKEFALAFGDDALFLTLLGFSSPDALGEWLG